MELSNSKWDFYAKFDFMEPHFDFYWQWRPHDLTENVRMQVNMEIICSICILQVFLFLLISINFSFFFRCRSKVKNWWSSQKEENGLNFVVGDRKQQKLHLHLRVFFAISTSTYGNQRKHIRAFESFSLCLDPRANFFSSRFSLRQFACVQERKEVNTHMRTVLRNCLLEQWSCAWSSSKVVSQKQRRSENLFERNSSESPWDFFREWSGNDVN